MWNGYNYYYEVNKTLIIYYKDEFAIDNNFKDKIIEFCKKDNKCNPEDIQYIRIHSSNSDKISNRYEIKYIPEKLIELDFSGSKYIISDYHRKYYRTEKHVISKVPDNLPETLQILKCNDGFLTEIPDIKNIKHLNVSRNNIKSINLTDKLKYLNISNNPLTNNPFSDNSDFAIKYNNIKRLYISNCNFENLVNIPQKLHNFDCSHNKLTSLNIDNMPLLKYVYASYNNLTSISYNNLPIIKILYISYNNLTELPDFLPSKIVNFTCNNNKLTYLPNIINNKKLYELNVSNNNLIELSELPREIYSALNISYNNIKFLSPHNFNILKKSHIKYPTTFYRNDFKNNPFYEEFINTVETLN